MSIGSTITAPSPARPSFAPPRTSPLNPTITRPSVGRPPTNTRTHLSNLDRLLLKQSPPQESTAKPHESNNKNNNHPTRSSHEHKINRGNGSGLFNALNLNTIIPSLRNPATEAMSPRSLTHLQRLLDSPNPSPKTSIASRWKLYHGSDNWANLLDPIDENLRRELVRYGDLVQAAYHTFHSNPTAPPSKNRQIILPDRNYKVTKSLYATSSVDLPKWLEGAASWMTQRSSWIGYVAVCDNAQEIKRMGRRDIVISLRGTATCMEWAENFRSALVPIESGSAPRVGKGFYSLYKTSGEKIHSLSSMVVAEVKRLIELYKGEELSITVTGHSLGAALALFVADEVSTCGPNVPNVAVFSFGGPRVGNKAFADRLEKNNVKVLRVVNANDVVTRVPGVLPREEIGKRIGERWGSLRSYVMHGYDGYVHAGTEFKVDSKSSPYLKEDPDMNCSHDLESYLHLVDGFAGSEYPFRSDAKRSLSKLMIEQRSNLRTTYVTHAMMLGFDRVRPETKVQPRLEVSGFLRSSSGYLPSPTS